MTLLPSVPSLADYQSAVPGGESPAAASYSDTVLADTPNGYWRLADLTDSSGNSLTLTQVGSPTNTTSLLTGDANGAKAITTGTGFSRASGALIVPTSAWTVEAWMKPSYVGDVLFDIVRKGNHTPFAIHYQASGEFLAHFTNTDNNHYTSVGTTVAVAGSTYHVVGTWDGTNLRVYVNGAHEGTPTATALTPNTNTDVLEIGFSTTGIGAEGVIDEVALYPTALSAGRIAAHYTAGHG